MNTTTTNEILQIEAISRESFGKAAAKALKKTAKVPAVINDSKGTSTHIAIASKALNKMHAQGELASTVFNVSIDGKKPQKVFVKDVQQHCVTDHIEHVDFQSVAEVNKIKVFLYFTNTESSPGIKKGGLLNIVSRSIVCLCPADKLIRAINIDIAPYDIGHAIRVKDLPLPSGIVPAYKKDTDMIANMVGKKGKSAAGEDKNVADAPSAAAAKNTKTGTASK